MNDKQQLAAIGEQLTAMGERMGVQVQPLCMAKRIEELEAQLAEKSIKVERLREMNLIAMKRVDGMLDRDLELSRLQSLMSEGWQLVPEPAVAEGGKPRLTGVNGIDAEFSVKFPSGFDGDPEMHFQSLCIDGDWVSGGQHICAMLAAANWLIDKAEWYRKGSAVINQPCAMLASAPSPDSTK